MAKGQIHLGKNGPEKCSVDSSNPKSRGCPFEATGHYSTADEAVDSYATLNGVDSAELKELVADGASPKDAVGLIRSGYGRDYLLAAKRDSRVRDTALEDASASYLDAKTRLILELKEIAPGITVRGVGESEGSAVSIHTRTDNSAGFHYVIVERKDELKILEVAKDGAANASEVKARLTAAVQGADPALRADLEQLIGSYRKMLAEERLLRS